MRRVYAQLPCVIVTYIPGKDLVAAKIGIGRKGCSKRPICTQLRGPQMYKSSALKLDREWTHRASGHLDEDVGQESMRLSIRMAGRYRWLR